MARGRLVEDFIDRAEEISLVIEVDARCGTAFVLDRSATLRLGGSCRPGNGRCPQSAVDAGPGAGIRHKVQTKTEVMICDTEPADQGRSPSAGPRDAAAFAAAETD